MGFDAQRTKEKNVSVVKLLVPDASPFSDVMFAILSFQAAVSVKQVCERCSFIARFVHQNPEGTSHAIASEQYSIAVCDAFLRHGTKSVNLLQPPPLCELVEIRLQGIRAIVFGTAKIDVAIVLINVDNVLGVLVIVFLFIVLLFIAVGTALVRIRMETSTGETRKRKYIEALELLASLRLVKGSNACGNESFTDVEWSMFPEVTGDVICTAAGRARLGVGEATLPSRRAERDLVSEY